MVGSFASLAQAPSNNGGGAVAGIIGLFVVVIELALIAAIIVGMWKLFEKAGQPGWAAIVPIYNIYILLQIVGKPVWWLILFFIPVVNFVAAILVALAVAERFGKSPGFGIGLALLPFVFYPLLGFSDAVYTPPTDAQRGFPVTPTT